MPVNIPRDLPARATLEAENIFVMSDEQASHQDIRPLKIAILNLMPLKIATETQLLRMLGSTPLQVEVTLLHMATHESRNTSPAHLDAFYATWEDVQDEYFDGLIITGAPIEKLPFEDVGYWPEMTQILDWSRDHVFSTMHVCWGAQAALYHHYGVGKHELPEKIFGVFDHEVLKPRAKLLSGFDERFVAPHSRHTDVRADEIEATGKIELLAISEEAGVFLAATPDCRQVFVTGHPEYDSDTLDLEYRRDLASGQQIAVPKHYFPNDDPSQKPVIRWRGHGFLLYANWLNYCVYQETPFDRRAMRRD
ncbi:homoserine O-acetyltransferase MetA [Cumulibacter manganitolerans]|uniref:homoserine O-acetyltransferase MetA n=1 Tax=Cumulibacter manganitolerans TaxID=1884992 RepID=UPI0012965658|nr:homoserine O-succinyltransferase [Cumulibacter manganitolerans]